MEPAQHAQTCKMLLYTESRLVLLPLQDIRAREQSCRRSLESESESVSEMELRDEMVNLEYVVSGRLRSRTQGKMVNNEARLEVLEVNFSLGK